MVADKIVWLCRRLLLSTLTPQERKELKQIRRLVLEDLGLEDDPDELIEVPVVS